MIVSDSLSYDLVTLFVSFLIVLIVYFKWNFQYWHRRNLPYLEPRIPFGNVSNALRGKENLAITVKQMYDEMKEKRWKHGGFYFITSPTYLPISLEYVKNITTKDFEYFTDHTTYVNEKEDPLDAHLFNICGTKWQNLRKKLTPTFTSGKLKMMFQTLIECQNSLIKNLDDKCTKKEPIDIKETIARYTTDIIGSCAFGLELKTFEQENSPFRKFAQEMIYYSRFGRMKKVIGSSFPKLAKFLNISYRSKEATNFFMGVVKNTIDYRERNDCIRNDVMQLLINLKNKEETSLTLKEIAAQCFVFFAAGFETSSTLMAFTLYELSKNPEIQEKVRTEINSVLVKYDGKITYDAIQDMKYLDQVIDEILRMYPPLPLTNRRCVKDYKIPNEDVIIEKGTNVFISILAIHHDPEYYPDPEKFDPERFNEQNKKSRPGLAHIPFGEGPRNCIGMRFGLMQSKVGLSCLLKNYKFSVSEKTREPFEYQRSTPILSTVDTVWLNAQKVV